MRASLRVLLVVVLAACGARAQATETLTESVRSFNDGVRWERFTVAAVRIPARERTQFVEDMDLRAEELKITDYEIVSVDARGTREARVQVKLSWYRPAEGTLRETRTPCGRIRRCTPSPRRDRRPTPCRRGSGRASSG